MKKILISSFFFFSFLSCGDKYNNYPAYVFSEQRGVVREKNKEEKIDESLLKTNQVLSEKERQQIQGYISRRNWNMKYIDGIFLQEIKIGNGQKISDTNSVSFDYTLELINGQKIYSSKTEGLKSVIMNKEDSQTGLVYALRNLSNGSKARVIIPAHLGYGLYGDQKSIPRNATLVYELDIKSVK